MKSRYEKSKERWINASSDNFKPLTTALKRIVADCPPKSKVLEIGSGAGRLIEALRDQKDCECKGIDISPANVKEAQRRGLNVIQGDVDAMLRAQDVRILAQEVDVLVFSRVLCYLEQKNQILNYIRPSICYLYEGQRNSYHHYFRRIEKRLRYIIDGQEMPTAYLSVSGYSDWMAQYGFRKSRVIHWNVNSERIPVLNKIRSSSVAIRFDN